MDIVLAEVEQRSARTDWSADAFNCSACPKDGCPAWWTMRWEAQHEDGTKEKRVHEGCGIALAPGLLQKVLVEQNWQRKLVEERTNAILALLRRGLGAVAQKLLLMTAPAGPTVDVATMPQRGIRGRVQRWLSA